VILTKAIYAENIYEYDLKGFFDSVRVRYVTGKLADLGVPMWLVKMVRFTSASYARLPKTQLVNETAQKLKMSVPESQWWRADSIGFPQGAPTSPFLSILALEKTLFQIWEDFVQYADDGL